ncbi:MAG: S8 family serine peptidase, partial [Anaerolineae bacterium]
MQKYRHYVWLCAILLAVFAYLKDESKLASAAHQTETNQLSQSNELAAAIAQSGRLRVLVQLNVQVEAEGSMRSNAARNAQREMIAAAQNVLQQDSLQLEGATFLSKFETLPLVVMEVDSAGLQALEDRGDIAFIVEDEVSTVSSNSNLETSHAVIGTDAFHTAGYTGKGSVIAILDTGVDVQHSAFNTGRNRIIAEGCFSTESTTYGGVYSVCPNGAQASTQPGAADDCINAVNALGLGGAVTDCKHGTHVAGIIGANDADTLIGIAPDADLIPVQVFSAFNSYNRMLSFTSDQIRGLEYILTLADDFNIVAVNMSLGGSYNPSACNFDVRRQAILNLHSVGIATIVAAGNEGYRDGVGKPSCIDEVITVGATNNNDTVAPFSNISDQIDLLAPGSNVKSAFPNESSGNMSGTSMAAPMVAGTFALLAESDPEMSIEKKLFILQESGKTINDQRSTGEVAGMKRIDLEAALTELAGSIHLDINAPAVLFNRKSETISVTLFNDSDLISNGILLSITAPSTLELVESSISNEGTFESNTVIWKNLTLAPTKYLTVTFDVIAGQDGEFVFHSRVTDSEKRTDETDYTINTRPILSCNSHESFEELPAAATGWQFQTGVNGQIRASAAFSAHNEHSLVLEDSAYDGIVNLAVAEVGIDASDSNTTHLDLSWLGHGIYSAHPDTGLFMSTDRGESWFKIAKPTVANEEEPNLWQHLRIDLADAAQTAGKTLNDFPFLRLQFLGDGSIDLENPKLSSGLIIDDFQVNCNGSLTWDGGAGTTDWSEPLNWSPNLRPHGNDLRFDGSSPLFSEVDADFKSPIGDLIITANWQGTLSQTHPLTITGDFMQHNGLIIVNDKHPFSVEGSFIFIDGALSQTQSITTTEKTYLAIATSDKELQKQRGVQLNISELDQSENEATVTIAGPNWSPSGCASTQPLGGYGINRCFEVTTSTPITAQITAKIWLEESELLNIDAFNAPGGAVVPGEEISSTQASEEPPVQLLSLIDASWVSVEQYQLGQESGRPFVTVELDQPGKLITQKIVRVPTAVTLSIFKASSSYAIRM